MENSHLETFGKGKPVVTIMACTHGNEIGGLYAHKKVKDYLKNNPLKRGTLNLIVANLAALKKKVRFIEADLNRVYPGKKNGLLEERTAYQLAKIIRKSDYLIDLHSTYFMKEPFVITPKLSKEYLKLIQFLPAKRVICMPTGQLDGMASDDYGTKYCIAIGVENGLHHKAGKNCQKTVFGALAALEMIDQPKRKQKQDLFQTEELLRVPCQEWTKFKLARMLDFKLVKKGSIIGSTKSSNLLAKKDFYPVLIKKEKYKTTGIICFAARKIS
jgi:succinylglutamate desuccinylase